MDETTRNGKKGLGLTCVDCGQRACYIFRGKDYCEKHLEKAIAAYRETKNGKM